MIPRSRATPSSREDGQTGVPLDAPARRVLGLQLADLLDGDTAVLQPHDPDAETEFHRVDAAGDGAAGATHLVVGLVVVDDDRDTVIKEGPPSEVGAIGLQEVPRRPSQRRELAAAALAHQQRIGLVPA